MYGEEPVKEIRYTFDPLSSYAVWHTHETSTDQLLLDLVNYRLERYSKNGLEIQLISECE